MTQDVIRKMAEAVVKETDPRAWEDFSDLAQRRVENWVRAALAAAEAAGWQLMSTKHDGKAGLTHEMCDAFWAVYSEKCGKHGHYEATNAGYNALCRAAPRWEP